jgi:hypothetical protein
VKNDCGTEEEAWVLYGLEEPLKKKTSVSIDICYNKTSKETP